MLRIKEADLRLVNAMITAGVLQDINIHKLPRRGFVLLTCGDGHQLPNIIGHFKRLYSRIGVRNPCIHGITRHGGPIRLAPNFPLNKRGRSFAADLLDEIWEALETKKLETILNLVHAPCTMAVKASYSCLACVNASFAGEHEIKKHHPNLSVVCALHTCIKHRRRVRYVPRKIFFEWRSAGSDLLQHY